MTSMKITRGPILVAVSGPDGFGKTTLAHHLAGVLRQRGYAVTVIHCYGCVACRRVHTPCRWREKEASPRSPGAALLRGMDRAHGVVDTLELLVRLVLARLALARHPGRPDAIITDRGPLDTLAKFDPAPHSATARALTRLLAGYRATVLLEGTPPVTKDTDTGRAAGRIRSHRYERWAREATPVRRVRAGRDLATLSSEAMMLITDAELGPDSADAHRRHVVISNFDNTGLREYAGGSAVTLERVARSLAREFDVTVVTAGRRAATRTDGAVTYRYLPVSWAGPRAGQLLFQAMVPLVARRTVCDLWLENLTPPFPAGLLPLAARAPVVGIDKVRYGEFMRRKYHLPFGFAERFGYRRYRDLVVMNHADAAEIRRLSPRTTVEVIPNGIDLPPQQTSAPPQSPAAEGDEGYVLFLGRIDTWQKGLDLLLTAYTASGLKLPLVLAGRGTRAEEQRLTRLLADLPGYTQGGGRPAAVTVVGHVAGERKRRLLQGSTFVVMPSRQETFGVVALEAMAYGKPVVHFDLPALRWTDGAGVVRVPPFDVDALAATMRELADDPDRRAALGHEAVRTARRFTAEAMTQQYLSLVRRLLDESAATTIARPGRAGPPPDPADTTPGRRPR